MSCSEAGGGLKWLHHREKKICQGAQNMGIGGLMGLVRMRYGKGVNVRT